MLSIHRGTQKELHSNTVRRILAQCVYRAEEDGRLARALDIYDAPDAGVFVGILHGRPVAVLGFRRHDGGFEIRHLAVDHPYRRRNFGRRMVLRLVDTVAPEPVFLETDGDALEFYRRCGFSCQSLGEKYPGIERFGCTFRHTPA